MAAIDLPINDPTLYMLASPAIIAVNPSMTSGSMSQPDSSAVASPRPAQATDAAAPVSSNINNAASTPSSSAALASLGTASSPTDVLLTLPPPILRLLVVSAPFIDVLAHFVQLLTWTHPNRFAPFLLPIAWITITLGGHALIKYGLNGALLTILGLGWVAGRGGQRFNKATARTTPPTHAHDDSSVRTLAPATINQPAVQVLTPAALNRLLDQSSVISIHLQALRRAYTPVLEPFTWRSPGLSYAWLNLLLTSYPFYLILTYFVPTSHIVCFAGITVLLWEAPWFAVIRRTLWSSVLVRRTARLLLRLLQGELRFAKTEVAVGQPNIGILAGIRSIRAIRINVGSDIAASPMKRAPSKSSDVQLYSRAVAEAEAAEVQYLFTIFENQRWWIGLEWTQALLPNERPSWSDPTHAACSPPGSFALPTATTVNTSTTTKTYTWKWSDPEWRIRGTAGIMISPSTIGANLNPPAAAPATATAAQAKDLKGSLGDWKNMLNSRSKSEETSSDRARRGSTTSITSGDDKANAATHARKGSSGFFADLLKDGKPAILANVDKVNKDSKDAQEAEQKQQQKLDVDPKYADDLPGHPQRMDDTDAAVQDLGSADWVVDNQGWAYADNHWEKPSSKGGLGRYTRRRAWVRRAIVIEHVEPLGLPSKTLPVQPQLSEVTASADLTVT